MLLLLRENGKEEFENAIGSPKKATLLRSDTVLRTEEEDGLAINERS